ncbi:MAG TPA: phosphoribosylanthranilate isomerase [Thermoleophilaceae bacterium]|nr:phosphoribosylanthranilate isomerase [Thermoleophilaceae bacterium]
MTRVKVCGITNLGDARRAADLGAWAIGLIFHEPSPRACALPDAEAIGRELKRAAPEVTGVFVNRPLDEVVAIADACELSILQLHGEEGPAYCDEAARRTGCKVMKAVQVRNRSSLTALRPFHVDFHLLDAHHPDLRGGTGATFDWDLIKRRRRVPMVLSGGLTPENVADGIAATQPFAVDTASGTEAEPGSKDPEKLDAFFGAVAHADELAAA